MRTCGSCGATAADDAKFCAQCASPLGEAHAAVSPGQERRQVTVFFSDLSGFTALNERLDPEDVRDMIGTMVRNPGFVFGHARKASQTARDLLADLSENLSPDHEGTRFAIEFTLAKLLIKRKERAEGRKHLEKAIAFLQPLGDTQGMRDARALLASFDSK